MHTIMAVYTTLSLYIGHTIMAVYTTCHHACMWHMSACLHVAHAMMAVWGTRHLGMVQSSDARRRWQGC